MANPQPPRIHSTAIISPEAELADDVQIGPHVVGNIRRLSETRGDQGEEKLSCAAAPDAYADALDFLNEGMA